jgi:hypothetical protein
MKSLKRTILAAAAALTAAGGASAGFVPTLAANDAVGTTPRLIVGVYDPAQPVQLEKAAWFWGGNNYCWYPAGWHGPGYYWCGYAWRRGFGWGGSIGWHGWGGGGWRGGHGGWRGGHRGWHGGHGGWHGSHDGRRH